MIKKPLIRNVKLHWLLNTFIPLFITIFLMEGLPYVASPIILDRSFKREEVERRLDVPNENPEEVRSKSSEKEVDPTKNLGRHVLHPYIGFVNTPDSNVNPLGFLGPDPRINTPNTLKVFITGGSVALGVFSTSRIRLKAQLLASRKFGDKKIEIYSFAGSGYKQPQQLMALSYLFSLGVHPDILINLDGFNEIALPYAENLKNKIFPSYPRLWNLYSRKHLDSSTILLLGKLQYNMNQREANRISLKKSFFIGSNLRLFLWDIGDSSLSAEYSTLSSNLELKLKSSERDFQSFGPQYSESSIPEFFTEQAELWKNSSIAINKLMGGKNYFHFFQPNQYDTGAKTLTAEELRIAFEYRPYGYREAVQHGYPIYREAGLGLKNQGVAFFDLSRIFINEVSTVYADRCCHFNKSGYDKLVDAIGQAIIDSPD